MESMDRGKGYMLIGTYRESGNTKIKCIRVRDYMGKYSLMT